MFKLKGCTHERQRPAEHSEFRLLQGAWSHFGQRARREGPRDEAEQVGKDKITPRLDCIVQFQKERDTISGIAGDPSRAGSRVKGGLEGSTLEIGRWLRDRKYSCLSDSALKKSIFQQCGMLCGQTCSNRLVIDTVGSNPWSPEFQLMLT